MKKIKFTAAQGLLKDVITRQAGDRAKGIMELIQNALDGITVEKRKHPRLKGEIRIEVLENGSKSILIFEDNGCGLGSNQTEISRNFSIFGLGNKRDDEELLGEFSMGRGQAISMIYNAEKDELDGSIEVYSNGHVLKDFRVDEELGFSIERSQPKVKGTRWEIISNVPSLFRDLEIKHIIEDSVATETPIYYNGELMTGIQPKGKKHDYAKFTVWIDPNASQWFSGGFAVFDRSLKVCTRPAVSGWGGTIITKVGLKQNFARNDVLETDSVLNKAVATAELLISEEISKLKPGSRLNDRKRDGILYLATTNLTKMSNEWGNLKVFSLTNGKKISLNELKAKKEIYEGRRGDATADRLNQKRGVAILDSNLPTMKAVLSKVGIGVVGYKNAREGSVTHGFLRAKSSTDYTNLSSAVINKECSELQKILQRVFSLERRKLLWGKSDVANGWTDGETRITLNLGYVKGKLKQHRDRGILYVLISLHDLVSHEMAHNRDDTVTMGHGYGFEEAEIKQRDLQVQKVLSVSPDVLGIYEEQLGWRTTMKAKEVTTKGKKKAATGTKKGTAATKKTATADLIKAPDYFAKIVKEAGLTIAEKDHTKSYILARDTDGKTRAGVVKRKERHLLVLSGTKSEDVPGTEPISGWGYSAGIETKSPKAQGLLLKHLGLGAKKKTATKKSAASTKKSPARKSVAQARASKEMVDKIAKEAVGDTKKKTAPRSVTKKKAVKKAPEKEAE